MCAQLAGHERLEAVLLHRLQQFRGARQRPRQHGHLQDRGDQPARGQRVLSAPRRQVQVHSRARQRRDHRAQEDRHAEHPRRRALPRPAHAQSHARQRRRGAQEGRLRRHQVRSL